jgi:zinc transport system substrate-binding protein
LKTFRILFSVMVLALLLGACNSEEANNNSEDGDKLTIYTSIYPLKDFAEKIGGEYVAVESIIPPGADSHTYEPTSKEVIEIAKSDAFIYNGLGMEAYAETIQETLQREDVMIVEASSGVEVIEHKHDHAHEHAEGEANEEEHDHSHSEGEASEEEHDHEHEEGESSEDEHHHDHGDQDPHVWLDPYRAIVLAENIKDALIELKPEQQETFEQNYETLKKELEELDSQFHTLIASKENPEIVVSHAAYGYWEESFGITQIPIAGLSPSEEPSQSELSDIVQLAKEHEIKYVIFETNVTPKVAEIIREEINAEPLYLHNISTLTEEDLENGEDYFSLMKANLETLDKALQ